jgi:hypothetical protein
MGDERDTEYVQGRTMTRTAFKAAFRYYRRRRPYGSYVAALDAVGADFFPMCRTFAMTMAAEHRQQGEYEIARHYLSRVKTWALPMNLPKYQVKP